VANSLFEEFTRDEYAPPLPKRMIAAGGFGRTSGRGFCEYTQAGQRARAPSLSGTLILQEAGHDHDAPTIRFV
jgi:3-hydroxyacyl-CoA dehydrogenase